MVVVATASALVVGFLAGLLSFKVKSRWCPHCGAMTTAELPDRATVQHPPNTPNWSTLPTRSFENIGRAGALTPAQERRANGGR